MKRLRRGARRRRRHRRPRPPARRGDGDARRPRRRAGRGGRRRRAAGARANPTSTRSRWPPTSTGLRFARRDRDDPCRRRRHRRRRLDRDARADVPEVGEDSQLRDAAVVEEAPADEAGLRLITFFVRGKDAYGLLESERGVHRLVRISPFDQQHRRQTSFAEVDVSRKSRRATRGLEIKPEDVRFETFKASGAGGQYVNKTESAVRDDPFPTNTIVASQQERSQMQNRDVAMNDPAREARRSANVRNARRSSKSCAATGAQTSGARRSAPTRSIRSSWSRTTAPGSRPAIPRRCSRATSRPSSGRTCKRAGASRRASLNRAAAHRPHHRLLERRREDRDRARLGVRAQRGARGSGPGQRRGRRTTVQPTAAWTSFARATATGSRCSRTARTSALGRAATAPWPARRRPASTCSTPMPNCETGR